MKLSTEEKTTIYSFLSSIKEKMEYINAYYVRNFKQSIDCYVIETKKNSLLEVANEDYQNFSIWKLTEMLEKHILHHNFIKTTEEYYENFNDLKQWFEKHPLTKSALQKNIDILYDAFTFSYVTDGIGIEDEYLETGIIHLHTNYDSLHKTIVKFINKIRKAKCNSDKIQPIKISENIFIKQLIESCFKLQEEKTYFKDPKIKDYDLENKRNRMIRALLDVKGQEYNYVVKDQSQRGNSLKGTSSGEIDFLVEQNGNNFTIIEALNMDDLFDKTKLSKHEEKLKNCYDKLGNKFNVLLVYLDTEFYDKFSEKYYKYINERYGKNQEFFDTEKVNSFGFKIEIKHFFKVQHVYHLVFKIG